MSSRWSMYIVPDNWTLQDCMCVGYLLDPEFMMRTDEFSSFTKYEQENWDRLYDEIIKQPSIYCYTSDGCGSNPDHEKIMDAIPVTGRLYNFPEEAYTLVPELKGFIEQYSGKRYMCLN